METRSTKSKRNEASPIDMSDQQEQRRTGQELAQKRRDSRDNKRKSSIDKSSHTKESRMPTLNGTILDPYNRESRRLLKEYYVCLWDDNCLKCYKCKATLSHHRARDHRQRQYECSNCELQFSNRNDYDRHFQRSTTCDKNKHGKYKDKFSIKAVESNVLVKDFKPPGVSRINVRLSNDSGTNQINKTALIVCSDKDDIISELKGRIQKLEEENQLLKSQLHEMLENNRIHPDEGCTNDNMIHNPIPITSNENVNQHPHGMKDKISNASHITSSNENSSRTNEPDTDKTNLSNSCITDEIASQMTTVMELNHDMHNVYKKYYDLTKTSLNILKELEKVRSRLHHMDGMNNHQKAIASELKANLELSSAAIQKIETDSHNVMFRIAAMDSVANKNLNQSIDM